MKIDRRVMRALTAGVALGVAACGGDAEANGPATEAVGVLVEGSARVINVEVAAIESAPFSEAISLTGTVWADQDVTISAEEAGVIRRILTDKGTFVEEGRPLFKIDDRLLVSQVEEARAQSRLALETWERRKRLYEVDQVGSELAYLEARFLAEQTAARLKTLEERLDRTVIRAPISGVLDMRYVEIGTMVSSGTEVARIVSLDPVKIVAGVPERYAADVAVGSNVSVYFEVFPDPFMGQVSYVGATVDPGNRTFAVEIAMPNPRRVIKPEMVANLLLERRSWDEAIVVPQEAVVRDENGYLVFVVGNEDGAEVALSRRVELGASQRNVVMIEHGLEAGDRLIVVGQKQVASGDRVNIVGTR